MWKAKKRFCAHKFFAEHNYLIPILSQNKTINGTYEGGYVAYITANKFDKDSKTNARLIESTPLLLATLKDALTELKYLVPENFDNEEHENNWNRSIKHIQDVLDFAEGKINKITEV